MLRNNWMNWLSNLLDLDVKVACVLLLEALNKIGVQTACYNYRASLGDWKGVRRALACLQE